MNARTTPTHIVNTAPMPTTINDRTRAIETFRAFIAREDAARRQLADELKAVEDAIAAHELTKLQTRLAELKRQQLKQQSGDTRQRLLGEVHRLAPAELMQARAVLNREIDASRQALSVAVHQGNAAIAAEHDARIKRLSLAQQQLGDLMFVTDLDELRARLTEATRQAFDLSPKEETHERISA